MTGPSFAGRVQNVPHIPGIEKRFRWGFLFDESNCFDRMELTLMKIFLICVISNAAMCDDFDYNYFLSQDDNEVTHLNTDNIYNFTRLFV